MSSSERYVARNVEIWTRPNAEYTDAQRPRRVGGEEITWGSGRSPSRELRVLGDVADLDVVELGCGTAYFSAWLARRGARPVGVDLTPGAARRRRGRCSSSSGSSSRSSRRSPSEVPLPDASFDLALSEYGASIWADPYRWIPEAARLLRPGGELVFLRNSTLVDPLRAGRRAVESGCMRPQFGMHRFEWPDEGGSSSTSRTATDPPAARERLRGRATCSSSRRPRRETHEYYDFVTADWARKWPAEEIWVARKRVSAPPAPPLLLASTSPQRRAILEQLGIPFEAVAPRYEEDDRRDADAVELVREHARGRRTRSRPERASARCSASTRPSCSTATTYGKPADAADAERMLEALRRPHARRRLRALPRHARLGGSSSTTRRRVTFRPLTPRELAVHVAHGEWQGRAGGYAIQGRGGALVERIEGDYLNVVGLPAALLVRILAERFPGVYGFG